MTRVIPALLLCAAGAAAGVCFSSRLSRRAGALAKLQSAFETLRNNVVFLSMPLAQALRDSGEPLSAVRLPLGSEAALWELFRPLGFERQDAQAVFHYLEAMTAMSYERRTQVCDGAIDAVSHLRAQAETRKAKDGRLYTALGVMAGAAAGILIL